MVRGNYRSGLPVFLFGVLAGILCKITVILRAHFSWPTGSWSTGIIVLVDTRARYWDGMLAR